MNGSPLALESDSHPTVLNDPDTEFIKLQEVERPVP